MIVIPKILTPEQLAPLREHLARAEFVDGKLTAGGAARAVKNNLQLKRDDVQPLPIDTLVAGALTNSPQFRAYVSPRRILPPIFSRYAPGMSYGGHVDDAIMGLGQPLRTDIACTLFLSEPGDYDGGELVVRTKFGERSVKLPAGDAVVYAASTHHWVNPVTRGERLVAATWAQSYVRDAAVREILFDLNTVLRSVTSVAPESDEAALLAKSCQNLLRLHAEA